MTYTLYIDIKKDGSPNRWGSNNVGKSNLNFQSKSCYVVPKFYQILQNDFNIRPLSDDEQKANVPRAVSCNEHRREVSVLQSLHKQVDRVFTFDKVWLLFCYNYFH